jgi:acetylornithine deacetylase
MSAAPELSRAITRVLSHIDGDEVLSLAKSLIRIPSPTEGEKEVAQFLQSLLAKEGFEILVQEVSPGRPQVIARLRGTGQGRSLMLNGHMDNDSITGDWKWDPLEPRVEGNRLWGHGVHNMKSGLAALISAAVAVKRSGVKLAGDLVVACVVGELQGGKGTIHMLKSGIRTDMAVIPEPYSTNVIITKCVGVHKCAISTIGKSIHTSRSHLGIDAIQKMLKVIDAVKRLDLPANDPDLPDLPRVLVASIKGGRGKNDIDLAGPSNLSDRCIIIVDVRYGGHWTPDQIDARFINLLESLKQQDPEFKYEYHHPPPPSYRVGGADMPPMNSPADIEIATIIAEAHKLITGRQVAQRGVVLPYSYCGNDTAHLERAGIPCCLYGPRGDVDEVEKHVRIDEMLDCTKVLAATALRVCA